MKRSIYLIGFCVAVISALLLTGCANYNTWTRTDKVMAGFSITASAADAYTTDRCLNQPNISEANPILGKNPNDARIYGQIAITQAIIFWVADKYPKTRKFLLGSSTIGHGVAAKRNANLYKEKTQ